MSSEGEKSLIVGILIVCVIMAAVLINLVTGVYSSDIGDIAYRC